MKHKRLLSAALTLCMLLTLLPTAVLAADDGPRLWVNGEDITSAQDYTVACGDGTAVYDPGTETLTLENAEITQPSSTFSPYNTAGIYADKLSALHILLKGTNQISLEAGHSGIFTWGSLFITGEESGSLAITGASTADRYIDGIYGQTGITLSNVILDMKSTPWDTGNGVLSMGIGSNHKEGSYCTIEGSAITMDGYHVGITAASNAVSIKDSTITIQNATNGIHGYSESPSLSVQPISIVDSEITLSGLKPYPGDFDAIHIVGISGNGVELDHSKVTATIDAGEGNAIYSSHGILIKGGSELTLQSCWAAIYCDAPVAISDSTVNAISTGDAAIYSAAGDITIGGTAEVTAKGYYPALNGKTGVTISGGTVNATSTNDCAIFSPAAVAITGGTAAVKGDGIGILSKGSLTISGGTVTADAANQAMSPAPDLDGYANVAVTASTNQNGTAPEDSYDPDAVTTYKYLKIEPDGNVPPTHTHQWSAAWSTDSTHHWHGCTADCPITGNSQKDGYGAHIYDNSGDAACNTCGYTRPTGGGDGGEDSGSSNSGTTPSTSTSGGTSTTTTEVKASTSGTTSTATVSTAAANSAVTAALDAARKNDTTPVVEIKVNTPAKADSVQVTLPAAALKKLGGHGDAALTITSGVAGITLDGAALAAVAEQAGANVTVAVEPVNAAELNARQREAVGDSPVFDITISSGSAVLHDLGGGTVAVSIPYVLAEGRSGSGLVVYYLDGEGNLAPCETSYDGKTGTVTFVTTHLSRYVVRYEEPQAAWENPFADVPEDAYYHDAVRWAVEEGVTGGTSAAAFDPEGLCTRAQVVTLLWRANGSPAAGASQDFSDVEASYYYAEAVRWAVSEGITSGTGEGRFHPDGVCTRAQVVTLLWRAAGSPAGDGLAGGFSDVAQGAYYKTAVGWATQKGITSGTGEGLFSPDGVCSRAQVVTFLYRALSQ